MINSNLVVIIPFYNEEKRLETNLILMKEILSISSLILINDGSTDSTLKVLTEFHKKNEKNTYLLSNKINIGKAESLRLGFNFGLREGFKFMAFTDGDFSTPPHEIIRFIERVINENFDIVCASRTSRYSESIKTTLIRRTMGRLFTYSVKKLLKIQLSDSQCGMKLFKATDNLKESLNNPFLNPWLFDVEIILRNISLNNSILIYENKLDSWIHKPGSKIRFLDPFKMLRDLLILRSKYKTYKTNLISIGQI